MLLSSAAFYTSPKSSPQERKLLELNLTTLNNELNIFPSGYTFLNLCLHVRID